MNPLAWEIQRFSRTISLLVALLVGLISSTAQGQTIKDVRLGPQGNGTRAIIELDQGVAWRVFSLNSPPRIVVDFTGMTAPRGLSPSTGTYGLVRDLRVGQFEGNVTRVVLDLSESARLADSFFLKPQGGASYRLVLDLIAGTPAPAGATIAQGDGGATPGSAAPTPEQPSSAPNSGQTVMLPPERPADIANQAKYVIVIDPGHGGRDPGAVSARGREEADLVLKMAKEISQELRRDGDYEVYLTRGTDRLVPLRERAELARGRAADFFLSIHANANPDPAFRGFMVFTLSETASDAYAEEVAARENKAELGAIADVEDDEVEDILVEMQKRDTNNQSIDFAAKLVERLVNKVRLTNKPQRRAGFAVLKSVRMPSALIEIGHLTNRSEAADLQTTSHRRKIAIAIRQALDEHFANN